MKLKRGKKTGLAYFNIDDINSWGPCYDPKRHLSKNFRGNALDILENETIPRADRFWLVLRPEIISERVLRLFSVWAFRQTLSFNILIDKRSLKAADTAEAYALGKASKEDLEVDSSASSAAATDAAAIAAASEIVTPGGAKAAAACAAAAAHYSTLTALADAPTSGENSAAAAHYASYSAFAAAVDRYSAPNYASFASCTSFALSADFADTDAHYFNAFRKKLVEKLKKMVLADGQENIRRKRGAK